MMPEKKSVLFLCTGNSARSQIAEAITNTHLGNSWQAESAGTHPTGQVHPMAIRVLAEMGIQHQGRSKNVEEFLQKEFDLVVTVCDSAAEECPLWLGSGKRVHFGFKDPAKATGSEGQVLEEFRKVRDEILRKISDLLKAESTSS
jgi:arsenate reductase (thioredoxin)